MKPDRKYVGRAWMRAGSEVALEGSRAGGWRQYQPVIGVVKRYSEGGRSDGVRARGRPVFVWSHAELAQGQLRSIIVGEN